MNKLGYICSNVLAGDWEFDANNHLDLLVYWLFFRGIGSEHRGRRFVEFGGQNGVFASNTRFFERFLGWTGMLIEPVCYPTMVKYRPQALNIRGAICNANSITLPGSSTWCRNQLADGDPIGKISVPCVNVGHLVRAHFQDGVDLMSIDVEGMEAVALEQLNFSMAADGLPYPRVSVMLIEWRNADKDRNNRVLKPLGYLSVRICKGLRVCTEAIRNEAGDELFWHPRLVPDVSSKLR